MAYFKTAQKGYQWVLTARGYDMTPEYVKRERAIGTPIAQWSIYKDNKVPVSWIAKGYVKEVKIENS